MMYKTSREARQALARIFDGRAYLIEGEVVSPAEEQLLDWLSANTPIKRRDTSRKKKRAIVGLARSLGLYPIPDWYLVRTRIFESRGRHAQSNRKSV